MKTKQYIYKKQWKKYDAYPGKEKEECFCDGAGVRIVKNGVILPQRNGRLIWGDGGCLDENGVFAGESSVGGAFGGSDEYDAEPDYLDESVIYIPIIPNHWGHFLIDTVSRLYILSDETYYKKDTKILYCFWRFEAGKLTGNYLRFFELLGISERNLTAVKKPVRVREIVIPKAALSYSCLYSRKYMIPVQSIVRNVINSGICDSLKVYDKIYFTRTRLASSQNKEIGEKDLEQLFESNGFKIMSPETLSLEEQIYYIHHCRIMTGLSGTIPHNIIFAGGGMQLVILNRTCIPNPPQLLLNRLCREVKVTYVDVYHQATLKHPSDYGSGPFWVEINENVRRFCQDSGMTADERRVRGSVKNAIKYYILLCCYRAVRNRLTIRGYRKIRGLISKIRR